ncbi:MAG: DUF3147 family protein [Candidatus Fermentibacteraceae bacterium]
MVQLVVKFLVSALLILAASEIAKRTGKIGALIAALPFVTIMVMVWLHVEHQGNQKVGEYAHFTFWYVLPTLPMFLLMSWLMSRNVDFWLSLLICALFTAVCFIITAVIARRLGTDIMP